MDGAVARLQPDDEAPHATPSEPLPAWAEHATAWVARVEWSAGDLAALELAELPKTEFRVREFLAREHCHSTEVSLPTGGLGLIWHRSSFPAWLRQAIDRRLQAVLIATGQSSAAPDDARLTRSQQQLARMSPKLASRAEARAEILDAYATWRAATGAFGWRGQQRFCAEYCAGSIAVTDATRTAVARICAASLTAWAKRREAGGLAALAGDYRPAQAGIEAEPELVATAEAAIAAKPHIRASHLRDILTTTCPDIAVPHLRSVQRWLANWKAANRRLHAHLKNPDAHRSRFRPAFGDADARITAPNQEWQADASPADILLADGKRYALIGIIDVFTRRLRFHVAPTSSGIGIGLVLRRCLLDFGVPRQFTTDNGADFTGRHIARVLRDLEVVHHVTPPFSPERKPFIERAFRTFAHDLVELLPGYIGHDVAGRKAIEARRSFAERLMGKASVVELRLSAAEFQTFADDWCSQRYEHRVHGSLRTTPALQAAKHTTTIRRIGDERALDVLLAPVAGDSGRRTVTKKGIRLDNGTFIAPALGSLVGEVVECRADPADAGRIYVFDADGRFVCIAVDPDREGVSREAIAEAARRLAARELRERKDAIKLAGKGRIDRDTIARDILNADAAAARSVVAFPPRAETHAPAALGEAGRAARATDAPAPPPRTQADEDRQQHLVDITKRRRDQVAAERAAAEEREKFQRLERAKQLFDLIRARVPISKDDAEFYRRYGLNAEFVSRLPLFGVSMADAMRDITHLIIEQPEPEAGLEPAGNQG
jgi:transposase InsO family protein